MNRFIVFLVAGLLVIAALPLRAGGPDVIVRAWSPLIRLAGEGYVRRAVAPLLQFDATLDAVLNRLDTDVRVRRFLRKTVDSFADFEMKNLYRTLPVKKGPWREVALTGAMNGPRYSLKMMTGPDQEVIAGGPRQSGADFSLIYGLRHSPGEENPNYMMRGRIALVPGRFAWKDMVEASTQMLRVITEDSDEGAPDPAAADRQLAARLWPHSKNRGRADTRLLALLAGGFPATSAFAAGVLRVDDLLVEKARGYHHVNMVLRLDQDRVRRKYDDLADYLEGLGNLLSIRTRILDRRGRNLVVFHTDTAGSRVRIGLRVRHGRILPFGGGKVYVNQPVDPLGQDLARTTVVTDTVLKVMGLQIAIRNMRGNSRYRPTAARMEMKTVMQQMPDVEITGAALGVFSPDVIDFLIPGNMREITLEFLRQLLKGNDGQGVVLEFAAGRRRPQEAATLEGRFGIEVLQNFLVRFGMSIVSDRVIPDEYAGAAIERLLRDLHLAFQKDLRQFSALAKQWRDPAVVPASAPGVP